MGYPDGLSGTRFMVGRCWPWRRICREQTGRPGTVEAIKQGPGSAFDPEAVRAFLRCCAGHGAKRQREVRLSDLRPGMVLAQGIYTASDAAGSRMDSG